MTDTARLDSSTDAHEGFKASPYLDTRNLWSVAKGRCLETNPLTGAEWKYLLANKLITVSITEAGADWLRDRDLANAESHLRAVYHWFDSIGDARQGALIEMCFQLGAPRFDGFHDMLRAAAVGNWTAVHDEALDSDWARETPRRAQALAFQLLTGAYPQS